MVEKLDNTSYRQAVDYLNSLSVFNSPMPQPETTVNKSAISIFKPFTRALTLDAATPVLQQKGIRIETARQFQAGAYRANGFLQNCIAVRLHDLNGNPLGYAGRRLDAEQVRRYGKWKFPRAFPKNQVLFNFHRIRQYVNNAVVVVECSWGVMRLAQLKIPAVALLGTHISIMQLKCLAQIPRVLVMFDGDEAGQRGAMKTCRALQPFTQPYLIPLFDDQDPDDLSDSKLLNILRPFFL